MTVEEVPKATEKKVKKNVLVGIGIDSDSRDLLNWAIVKVAGPGDCVIAVHVCSNSDRVAKEKPMLDSFLEGYQDLCSVNKVGLSGHILTGRSIKKVLVGEAKNHAAVAVVLGRSKPSAAVGGWSSMIKYFVKQLPPTTDVVALHNGKIVFRRFTNNQLPLPAAAGLSEDPRPSFNQTEDCTVKSFETEFGDSDRVRSCHDDSQPGRGVLEAKGQGRVSGHKKPSVRVKSLMKTDSCEKRLGWPLLLRTSSGICSQMPQARNLSVVQWAMSLPNRSPHLSPQSSSIEFGVVDEDAKNGLSSLSEPPENPERLLKANSSISKWFSPDLLKSSTSQFSSGNLIGKGGCNRVYKGILPDGKLVAVKVMNSSKEAWKDFAHEIDIISSLKHEHVTPLLGICIEDNALISVYDFFSKGSLEENLHGTHKDKCLLPWEVRFNVAVGIAEALNYLHNECPRPVIHRDVKTSNILLTDGFEPQLADFGLAIWGPKGSSFKIEGDILGTFGYLAPEYFMYGKVSDKIDVYAFGVVLLELLSGKEPISSESPKKQESLVMWAKPFIESGDIKGMVDPGLDGNFDEVQMQRMVLAATLCITRAARLRPKISEVLKLLKGEKGVEEWVNLQNNSLDDSDDLEDRDDEVYPNSSAELHLSLAMLDVDDDATSSSSSEQRNSVSLEEYFKKRWSRSSSFD